jgi:hypothetical protein
MRKGFIFIFIIYILLLTQNGYAIDDPHNPGNLIACSSCHFSSTNPSPWYTQPPDPSNPDTNYPFNRLCWSCHNDITATYRRTHSNFVINGVEGWSVECRTCHEPHYQRQFRRWRTEGALYSGTSTSVGTNTITKTGAGWVENQWQGKVVIGNVKYPKHNYRILSNTSDTLTVQGPINTSYVKAGNTFAIVYGKMVKDYLNSMDVRFFRNQGSKSFADGDTTYDGVCETCHTKTDHFRRDGTGPDQLHTNISPQMGGATCTVCHPHIEGFKYSESGGKCTSCHQLLLGNRVSVMDQFNGNSHHIQGVAVTDAHCYQCHWEANSDGSINSTYHGGFAAPGSAVDLVIYGAGSRPTSYGVGTTAIQYAANGTRTEIQKINSHCLGCHSDQNNSTQPFGDGKTPRQYAWDGTSVASRYSQAGTTAWGKYSGGNVTPKNTQTKAYSAHGNATNNQGGWNTSETWPNTRNGSVNIACFDCHNSHGSSVSGTTTSYASATTNGGILKDVTSGKGGYSMTYKPQSGGSASDKNAYNSGAGLCFDCHLTDNAGTTPWGYSGTFGATQSILGYWDSPYFGPGTFGPQQRYAYKTTGHKGGHFGSSSALSGSPTGTINGLCTPCHDPHGVSTTLGANQQYSVPLLKGTWLTSPYQEDVAPANNAPGTVRDSTYPMRDDGTPREGVQYRIDQNTFGANIHDSVTGITQTDTQFAGLCLNCHAKNSLTNGVNGGTWKSVDRIHESVKGWGANVRHKFSCSKCHTPHNSRLPRLMVTNCLDKNHKGRVGYNPSPVLSGSGSGVSGGYGAECYGLSTTLGFCVWAGSYGGSGGGNFPGSWSGTYPGNYTITCHETNAADQSWNVKTQW